MNATKLMFLGILIMLLGPALSSAAMLGVWSRTVGPDTSGLAYIAVAVLALGFIIGVIGFFRR